MFTQHKIRVIYVIVLASIALGFLISLLILQESAGSWTGASGGSQNDLKVAARFQNGRLVVSVTNLGSGEVEVQMIFLEGKNHMDFDTYVNVVVKPGENIDIWTEIMQPENGTYNVRVKLSNGRIISCKVVVK